MSATTLAELLAAGVWVEASGDRVRLREPRPGVLRPEHTPAVRAMRLALLRLAVGAWRQDLTTWPSWRRDLYEERAAIREYDGGQPRDLAERCAYLEAIEAPEEPAPLLAVPATAPPANDAAEVPDLADLAAGAPTLALLLEAFPGARVEVRPRRFAKEPENPAPFEQAPLRFQHRYRPPPEYPALPPFRWSVPPPPARRADVPASAKPPPSPKPPPIPNGSPTPLRSLCDPFEPPEHRAARFGYRINEYGSWVEGERASVAPCHPRFAVGYEPGAAEIRAHRAQLAAIERECLARLGPHRSPSPPPEPSSAHVPLTAQAQAHDPRCPFL